METQPDVAGAIKVPPSGFELLHQDIVGYLDEGTIAQIEKAYYYAEKAHSNQQRQSGEPYITHPLAVARILAGLQMDHQSLMAALLHDVIEDTGVEKKELSDIFDETVGELVDGVSKLNQIKFESRAEAQAENFQKMAFAMSRDIRVILVKLADRLHNMRTLGCLKPEKKRRIAKETLEIYAPIANRLGMYDIRLELEELGFHAVYPMRARRIAAAVKASKGHHKEIVDEIRQALAGALEAREIRVEVEGREKHLYSIYKKMRDNRKSFSEIMDVYGFRIVVQNEDQCYRVLGAVHGHYKPIPGRFKDYIAIPKSNGYQSLHTTLIGLHGAPIEIQIRTQKMEARANKGVTSHWFYKSTEAEAAEQSGRANQWIKSVMELQKFAGNPLEFIENVKMDLFPDEVYIFTPKGRIMELPKGATAIDFAYAVHTDIGNTCIACRINRRIAPLSQPLHNGQTVEIITKSESKPYIAWLNFVVTGKAKTNIRHTLKNQQRSQSRDLGRRLLEQSLSYLDADLESVSDEQMALVLEEFGFENQDELLEDLGLGNRMSYVVAYRLLLGDADADESEQENPAAQEPLAILGTEGMVLNYAKCCHPLPGDAIIGRLRKGRGVMVHIETCKNVADDIASAKESLMVRWDPEVTGYFSVSLMMESLNERGVLASLAAAISKSDADIEKIEFAEKGSSVGTIHLDVSVKDRIHLARLMKRLRSQKEVSRVVRLKNSV
ncbi:MAG: RelA/SpoT family protein [Pseudomonadales bacterium]|nr:RelA/SpoT family protein [Pseudomonadales bacterium]